MIAARSVRLQVVVVNLRRHSGTKSSSSTAKRRHRPWRQSASSPPRGGPAARMRSRLAAVSLVGQFSWPAESLNWLRAYKTLAAQFAGAAASFHLISCTHPPAPGWLCAIKLIISVPHFLCRAPATRQHPNGQSIFLLESPLPLPSPLCIAFSNKQPGPTLCMFLSSEPRPIGWPRERALKQSFSILARLAVPSCCCRRCFCCCFGNSAKTAKCPADARNKRRPLSPGLLCVFDFGRPRRPQVSE